MPAFRVRAVLRLASALALTAAWGGVTSADAAVSQQQAEQRALSALHLQQRSGPAVVFRKMSTVPKGTRIRQAGSKGHTPRVSPPDRRQLRDAGVQVVPTQILLTASEPSWFFYEDRAPYQAYEHPGRAVLVGRNSGRVQLSKVSSWPPLIGTKLPSFLSSTAAYRDPRYRAFVRPWALAPGAVAVAPPTPGDSAARAEAARLLGDEHACALRVSDTLGDFYGATAGAATRAALGDALAELSTASDAFVARLYTPADGSPAQFVAKTIRERGCRHILLYLAGDGSRVGEDPSISVGLHPRADGRLERQLVTASVLRQVLGENPDVTFAIEVDAPRSGAFVAAIQGSPNLVLSASSTAELDGSFTGLGDVVDAAGNAAGNPYNPTGLLEFTNRQLTGLGCFLSRPAEVAAAARAKARGRVPSFMAWMLARAFALCGDGALAGQVQVAPAIPQLRLAFEVPSDGDLNQAPSASDLVVATDEDTSLPLTLPASDSDGDALTFTVVDGPAHGSLTGNGAARTYAPATNFSGDDQFTFTASDGRITTAPRTVRIAVKPVDDPSVLQLGTSTSTFTEGGSAVQADPGITVADVDDTQLRAATVAIGAGFERGSDLLAFASQGAITGSYDGLTGVLTLTGTAAVADYQAALRAVTFDSPGRAVSPATRQLVFRVTGGQVSGSSADRAIAVNAVNDAPVLGGGGTAAMFVEDSATGEPVAPNVTVADVDSPTLAGATVSIVSGLLGVEDRLTFTAQPAISGTFDPATGVLTFGGNASVAEYQTILRSVRYRNANTANPATVQRAIELRVDDGAAGNHQSNAIGATADVIPVNDAPSVGASGASPAFSERGPAVAVDPALAVNDVDGDTIVAATATIVAGHDATDDRLALPITAGLTASFVAGTGTLTITGSATPAAYQAALRTVTYANTDGNDPSSSERTVRFVVDDGESVNHASAPADAAVRVTAINDAPTLASGGNSVTFIEDDATGVVVNPSIGLTDVDSPTLTGGAVQLGVGLAAAEDRLVFSNQNGITGTYESTLGTLTLTGVATVADYRAALRSVRYRNLNGGAPSTAQRSVTFTATDGAATSNAAVSSVSITPLDDAPTLAAGGGSPTFTEGGPGIAVDPAIAVADVDTVNLTGARVQITGGHDQSDDRLAFTDTAAITAVYTAATGTLALTGTASVAAYEAALRSVRYRNLDSDHPSTAARTVQFTVIDGTVLSNAASTTVGVAAVNDAPTVTTSAGSAAFIEDAGAVAVDSGVILGDVDNATFASASVQITSGYVGGQDILSFTNTASITGTFNASSGTLTLTGADTAANYQAALRTVRFANTSHTPNSGARTATLTVVDASSGSGSATRPVSITPVNDVPTLLAGSGNVHTFTEAGSAVTVDDAITPSDLDDPNLTAATVAITAGFSSAQGDTLSFTDQNGISGSYAAGTGVLSLSGTAPVASYQAALRSITFSNSSQAPTTSRTVQFTITDGSATSDPVSHALVITPVNTAPILGGGGASGYTENGAATSISPALTVTDPDTATLTGATVALTAGFQAGADVLAFAGTGSISATYNAGSGVLTLTGIDTAANYQAALRAVTYRNTSDAPSSSQRTITFGANDGTLTGTTTATIGVTAVNDAPIAADVTWSAANAAVGNTALVVNDPTDGAPNLAGPHKQISGDLLGGVSDPDSSGLSALPGTYVTNDGGSVLLEADGDYTFTPATGTSCTDTSDVLTYSVTDNESTPATDTATITFNITDCVWYVDNTAPAGGTGRSAAPFDTLDEADAAATTPGAFIYVAKGSGPSGLTDDVSLQAGQQLVGAAADLTVGGATLQAGQAAGRPSLSGTVDLDDANVVEGLQIASSSSAAIRGGSGDASGTLDDLLLTGTAGGLELSGTTGTWDVSDMTVLTTGGDAMLLSSAGLVNFSGAGTISITSTAGRGLTIAGTTTSGTVDSVTVNSSPTTGVSLTSTTGSLTLDDLNVTSTGTGLAVGSASGVTVNASGDGAITSAGTAVDLNTDASNPSNLPVVALNSVTSTGGARGIRINDLGAGTFSAAGGVLSGQTTAAVDIDGGSGNTSYGGAINDGNGLSAVVTNRTGGTVTLSGSINDSSDAGGGLVVTGSSGGTTVFSGATKKLNTAASTGLTFSSSGVGSALEVVGGGLDIDTTTGKGFLATGAVGTLTITGAGNTIASAPGTALEINGPDIAPTDAVFQSIATTGAPSGIVLANTGSAGGLHVSGTGTAGSGGTIALSSGPGIDLTNTSEVALAGVNITSGADDGIRGSGVDGFALTDASEVTSNGNAAGERGIDMTELSGTPSNPVVLSDATVTGSAEDNVAIVNDSANISSLSITGGTYGDTTPLIGGHGIRIENDGAGSTTGATISGALFQTNRRDDISVSTDNSNSATQSVTIQGNTLRGTGNQLGNTSIGGGVAIAAGGGAVQAIVIDGNDIERPFGAAVALSTGASTSPTVGWTVTNNAIGTSGEANSGSATSSGILADVHGNGAIRALVAGNTIYRTAFSHIDLSQTDGDAGFALTMRGNVIVQSGGPLTFTHGIRLAYGSLATDEGTNCLDLGHATTGALKNQIVGTGILGLSDLRVSMSGGPAGVLQLAQYSGGAHDSAAVATALAPRNDTGGTPSVSVTQVDGSYAAVASCPQP